jgi:hypothetical protein
MNTKPEQQEIYLQEGAGETPSDTSLPATQVIEDQNYEAEQNNAPRFIP